MDYITELQKRMEKEGANKEYIQMCSEYAQKLVEKSLPVIFDFKHLSLLLGYEPREIAFYLFEDGDLFYSEFYIPKKSDGFRIIDVPSVKLKSIQRWILNNILNNIEIHEKCYGFRKGKSIYDNAKIHVNKECVLNMDLLDFFPSIQQKDVFNLFYGKGYTKKVSYYLAKLLTKDGKLPQGSPASPMVSNIIATHLDYRLDGLAKKYKAEYSRYADDITFSGDKNIKKLIPIITKIIKEEKFEVNSKKTRLLYYYQRQEVTGLIVNKKVSIPKEYTRQLFQIIYYCRKYGVDSHLKKVGNEKSFFKEHIYGRAYFVYMIDKQLGERLLNELNLIIWDY